ncbi:4-hydroxy-tetrahydrodipicolinate synthase [Dasania sp. GY-MA-18]|uniref:4-hydroxy-tetrahydrodipicolinate synthase n=1 Tax=Dasania phycosphaerae TaxID=2950436 RepID=A0A9J6RR36_9GAMM|nr:MULTISPECIES: 4-hydroxy-tetrahydrodipicolinate synthase [Dasania]MCR8924042.1 4-hydroxy-tetrahydrodipicolinate synthase [Dasania sp. GY-MA-18]MCZ0866615.1 4-hydroxy-tetrahydrodipicolinate synthase [Dasania phycosphaerae]MCZ0870200.1 4-hydroxy-tetrahydrodipicolinate synthase [Dasania phycosphaerae]
MIAGSLVALVTPFTPSGDVDWAALTDLLDMHLEKGTHGIVAVGTTGESATLDVQEHCKVIRHTVEHINGRIPVIAGTGANSTREAIELTESAKSAKADACLLVTPYYNKPTQEGMYQHFKAVAEAVAIPQILYNVPGRTACDMLNDTVLRLAGISNIIGIKDATGDVARGIELIQRCGDQLAVYSGDDPTALELMLNGGKGDISVTANVAPAEMAQMCEAALKGDAELARQINQKIQPLHDKLFVEANPIPVKWALHEMGLIGETLRLPLTVMSKEFEPVVRVAMQESGIL